jgi:hypothetical protein
MFSLKQQKEMKGENLKKNLFLILEFYKYFKIICKKFKSPEKI